MNLSPDLMLRFCNSSSRIVGCTLLLFSASALGQENHSSSSSSAAVEQDALRVLNDSDWARTVTTTIQGAPCTYRNPAFPGLYDEEKGAANDAANPITVHEPAKADGSEYLLRFQSAKPVQTAIKQLIALGKKWSAYDAAKLEVSEAEGPTDLANSWYYVADMITIAVILKRPGPDGTSLFDYAYSDHGRVFPSASFRVWPCAGLRTSNGQVFAHLTPAVFAHDGRPKALQLSFPRLVDGKPLISNTREKVEFRLVANQRVFDATFFVNASDGLNGSEKYLYLSPAFTGATEMSRQ
jgi:hypothetical protein